MELGFVEYLVERERTRKIKLREKLTWTACLAGAVLLCVLAWLLLWKKPIYALLGCAFLAGGCFFLWSKLRPAFYEEFEYCIVADEMTISRIRGKEHRKELCVIPLRAVTLLAPLARCLSKMEEADSILDASAGREFSAQPPKTPSASEGSGEENAPRYCLFYETKRGKQAVILQAPPTVLRAMRPYCARAMYD